MARPSRILYTVRMPGNIIWAILRYRTGRWSHLCEDYGHIVPMFSAAPSPNGTIAASTWPS